MSNKTVENGVISSRMWDEIRALEIIPMILKSSFESTPETLVMKKPVIPLFGPAKIQRFEPVLSIPIHGFPHDQIVRPQVLVGHIRSAVLEYRSSPEMKKDRRCDHLSRRKRRDKDAEVLQYDRLEDISKESKRLGRKAMSLSRQTVQSIERPHGIKGPGDLDGYA